MTQIAEAIGFDKSTISRELRRNTSDGRYRATTAQREADQRLRRAQAKPAKLAVNTRLREEVERRLKLKQSPEQIANRLRLDFPTTRRCACPTRRSTPPSTSRAAVRCARTWPVTCAPDERCASPAPKPGSGRGLHPLRNVISISERPPWVEDRAVPGHWEGDLIMGTSNASAIGTLVERATGFLGLLHLPGDHSALTMQTAICDYMATLPEVLRQTLTWDRGVEMTNHVKIAEATGLDIYFADPGLTLAARQQREHQRTAAPVLPQRHRPVPVGTRLPPTSRPGNEQPPPQTPRLAHTRRSPRPTTLRTPQPTRRCTHQLNPPRHCVSIRRRSSLATATRRPEGSGRPTTGSYEMRAVRPVGPPGAPWHRLYFLPEPHGHSSLRPISANSSSALEAVLPRTSGSPVTSLGAE